MEVAGTRLTRVHDRIVGQKVTEPALDHELAAVSLGPGERPVGGRELLVATRRQVGITRPARRRDEQQNKR
jgi:hypothetical protein